MDPHLYAQIVDRLESAAPRVCDLVLAAVEGADSVEAVLSGSSFTADLPTSANQPLTGVYLKSISVEGFRGIGPASTLKLDAGPGLTLVLGRNGSGKSSFAEALEVMFTGENLRWKTRSKVWQDGWRNLHHGDARLGAEVIVTDVGTLDVRRSWAESAELGSGSTTIEKSGQKSRTLTDVGWDSAVESFRPFLSYNELASMLDEGPSKLYDAIAPILGLEDVYEASAVLRQARLARQNLMKNARTQLGRIDLSEVDDPRADVVRPLLEAKTWDLDAIEEALSSEDESETDTSTLRDLASIQPPDPAKATQAAAEIRNALSESARVAGTDSGRALKTAALLRQALEVHATHESGDCPVCGAGLNADWKSSTEAEAVRLEQEARSAQVAGEALSRSVAQARSLISQAPAALQHESAAEALLAWKTWQSAPESAEALADHLEQSTSAVSEAVGAVAAEARAEVERRNDAWRPIVRELDAWLVQAREAQVADAAMEDLKTAEKRTNEIAAELRDERFSPIAEKAQEVWNQLRQQSSIDLGGIRLEGTTTSRKVTIDVTIDGESSAALGVMSQGEINSLALALFLPRATSDASPFRFVVIDDPVQSMDPAKVDGLARALRDVAKHRQVVVFTHDNRLADAVRHMRIEATVLEVVRSEQSTVSIKTALDPVNQYLRDAQALVRTDDLPKKVAARVIPGLLRMAMEAACVEAYRRRRLTKGESHESVEAVVVEARRLTQKAALALFDDPSKTDQVMQRLNKEKSKWADAFSACNKGTHEAVKGSLETLYDDAYELTRFLEKL